MSKAVLQDIIDDFNPDKFVRFFREKNRSFAPRQEELTQYNDENFKSGLKLGEVKFDDTEFIICVFKASQPLSERSGKKAQYEQGKKILKSSEFQRFNAGIFIFYNENGNFRFSLIYDIPKGNRRDWNNFRRFTYFVSSDPQITNKTFLQQIGDGDFSSLEKIKDAFSVEKVTEAFYTDIANWYFWAVQNTVFPKDAESEKNGRNIAVIRMITRLIFIWFMKERGLIRQDLFNYKNISTLLKEQSPKNTQYYKAILQNLFFATLNTKIEDRKFRFGKSFQGKNKDYMDHGIYRYEDYFKNKEDMLELFKDIPFLNGGLFDCLDKRITENDKNIEIRIDGFTDKDIGLKVPNFLFFSDEINVDLNKEYGSKNKKYKVRGLIDILYSYNFTIDENDPNDADVALDPELLGKVFENLLASFNPETATTARKQTGSFYTPRAIVNYMVDESLIAYLSDKVSDDGKKDNLVRQLFAHTDEPHQFNPTEVDVLINAIDNVKILDPAVGSGAFPMGMLHKLVYILGRLDPDNSKWRELQRQKAIKETEDTFKIDNKEERIKRLFDIDDAFENNSSDYGRKLYLIENCLFGVDIQPIAVQIAKLRFFISLLVDQYIDPKKENLGVRPLPNLETKFVAANTLIGVEKTEQGKLRNIEIKNEIDLKETELKKVRERHFTARTPQTKEKCRKEDERLRAEISELLKKDGFPPETTTKLAKWNPYDQNASAEFFDPEWMFEITEGFDVVIGNPPYGILNKKQNKAESIVISDEELEFYKNSKYYEPAAGGMINIFRLFILRSINLLAQNGVFSEIFPLAFMCDLSISRLRKHILDNNKIICIEAFPERDNPNKRVFEAAKMSVCILNLKRSKNSSPFFIRISSDRYIDINAEKNYLTREIIDSLDKENCTLPLTSSFETNLFLKIFSNSIRFSEIGNCSEGEVHMTFCKKSFTNNPQDIKLLKGAIIDRYQLRTKMSQGEIVFIDEKILFDIKKNLSSDFKTKERIVSQGITGVNESSRLKMMIVKDAYCANSLNYLTLKSNLDLKYLLGIFNSKLLNFIFSKFSTNSNVNGYEINNLPIVINSAFVQPINKIVDKILAITKSSDYLENPAKQTKVKEYEQQIDQMVYKLYDLTSDEIKIVEGA